MKKLISVLSVMLFFASCETAELKPFVFDENGVCYLPSAVPISKAEFESKVVGYGWKNIEEYEIHLDGSYSNITGTMIGCGPDNYYFEDNHIKHYFFYDAKPADAYTYEPYSVTDPIGYIETRYLKILIVSVSDNEMTTIEGGSGRVVENGMREIYKYKIYKKMTEEELVEYNKKYNYLLE